MKNIKIKKRLIALPLIFILLGVVAFVIFTIFIKPNQNQQNKPLVIVNQDEKDKNETDYSPPKKEVIDESNNNKNEIIKNMDSPKQNEQINNSPISVSITRISRSNVSVYIENISEGTCNLSVQQNNIEKIKMTAKVLPQSGYATCEGFSLDASKLDSSSLKIEITVSSGNRLGKVSQELN